MELIAGVDRLYSRCQLGWQLERKGLMLRVLIGDRLMARLKDSVGRSVSSFSSSFIF